MRNTQKHPPLTRARLGELLTLDLETFKFTWNIQRQCVRAGAVAGSLAQSSGYRSVLIDGRKYSEHRLIWLYIYGKWPDGTLDHLDGVRTNNRIDNLRDVPQFENMQNQPRPRRGNKLGYPGVRPHGNGYQADIKVWGVRKTLGTFKTPDLAYQACVAEKQRAGIPVTHIVGV